MNIADAKQHIKDTVEAYLAKDASGMYRIPQSRQRPIFMIGAPGIGKTAIMTQIAQELGIGLLSYSMTHHTRQSALGLPVIVHHNYQGFEFDASEYTMSEIIASMYDYMDTSGLTSGILFLDEINCVSETLYPSMLQFLQFKTFGRHRVPNDWIVACAGNPPEYNKSVHEFDIVTLDRLRKLEVEPDYGAWKAYAQDTGVHPAITSFLEVKRDNFYSVESTPSGKRFVTARGWDDLSEVITLYETEDKPIDKGLIEQFLQDRTIAEKFALYYDLFNKYRADYKVNEILSGIFPPEIIGRAQDAQFDERLALLGLLLDALGNSFNEALECEAVLTDVRDELRDQKQKLLDGASLVDTVDKAVSQREAKLERCAKANTLSEETIRRRRLSNDLLKKLSSTASVGGALSGTPAFNAINTAYRLEVQKLDPLIKTGQAQLDNAFEFVDAAFGGEREMLVFVTELTARRSSSQFINRFGNDKYYEHNNELMVDERRSGLATRIADLNLDGDTEKISSRNINDQRSCIDTATNNTLQTTASKSFTNETLKSYYSQAIFEYGFPSMCKVTLPSDLSGKTILDVGCRRGKGVFKLSSRVGNSGRVIGVDWSATFIAEAKDRKERAWRESGLSKNNMEFFLAYPEDLLSVGIGDSTIDLVYVNSVTNLFFDRRAAFSEFARVLKPGARLVCETVFADSARDASVVLQARDIGNAVQAAPYKEDLEAELIAAGFKTPEYSDVHKVSADAGVDASYKAKTIDSSEKVEFNACVIQVAK